MPRRQALNAIHDALGAQLDAIAMLEDVQDVGLANAARFIADAIDLVDVAAQAADMVPA